METENVQDRSENIYVSIDLEYVMDCLRNGPRSDPTWWKHLSLYNYNTVYFLTYVYIYFQTFKNNRKC